MASASLEGACMWIHRTLPASSSTAAHSFKLLLGSLNNRRSRSWSTSRDGRGWRLWKNLVPFVQTIATLRYATGSVRGITELSRARFFLSFLCSRSPTASRSTPWSLMPVVRGPFLSSLLPRNFVPIANGIY